jgi:hypothetical protein
MTPHNPNSRIHAWTPPRSRYGFIQIRAPITRSRKIHSSAYSSPISRRLRSSKLHNISQSYTAAPPRRRYPAQVRCSTYLERGEVDNHRQRFRGDHAWAYIRSTAVSRPQAANQTYAVQQTRAYAKALGGIHNSRKPDHEGGPPARLALDRDVPHIRA